MHFDCAMEAARCDLDLRQALWGRFSATHFLDDAEGAKHLLDQLEELSGATADELVRVATGRLMLASLMGNARDVLDVIDIVAPLATRAHDPLIHSSFLNVHSALLALGGRYNDALLAAEQEIELISLYGLDFALPHALFQRALALFGLRAFRSCKASLMVCEREQGEMGREHNFLRMNIAILRARVHLAAGSHEALNIFERHQHLLSSRAMDAEYLAWRSLALAIAGQPNRARVLVDRAEMMSQRIEIAALVCWTKALSELKARRAPREAVQQAFAKSVETGNVDAFVSVYRACPDVLRILVKDECNHDQLRTILERATDHRIASAVGLHLPSAPGSEGLEILSKREREVLELLSQGLLNKEIARLLFISESTVKVHVRRICQKLGARTRTEAVMRASELDTYPYPTAS